MKFAGFGAGRESSRLSRASESAAEWDAAANELTKEQQGAFFAGDDAEVAAAFEEPDNSGAVERQVLEPVEISSSAGEGQPFVHMDLSGAGDEGQNETPFLGKRWRDVPDDMRVDAWEWLRSWVDWFTMTYRVQKKNIPPCWFMHSDVVEELWIAANAETKVWEEGVATVMPLTSWQNFVPGILGRLEPMVQRCVSGHVEEKIYNKGEHPFVRPIDEAAWANVVTSSINDAVDLEPGFWRAVVVGDDEQELEASEAVQVQALPGGDLAGVSQVFVGPGGRVFVQAWGLGARAVRWERQGNDGAWVVDELKTTSMVSAGDGLTDEDLREFMDERLRELIED